MFVYSAIQTQTNISKCIFWKSQSLSVRNTQVPLHPKRFSVLFSCLNAAVEEASSERDRLYALSFMAESAASFRSSGWGMGREARITPIVIHHPLSFKGFYIPSISMKSYKFLARKNVWLTLTDGRIQGPLNVLVRR
jgi:hypothetical protein